MNEDTRKPGRDMGILLLFLIILGILWYAQGGVSKLPKPEGLFLTNKQVFSPPVGGGSSSGTSQAQQEGAEDTSLSQLLPEFYWKVNNADETDAQKEYIELKLSKSSVTSVDITDWTLEGEKTTAWKIPQSNSGNIVLGPGDNAMIFTGKSPVNYSFHLNKCMGYFDQNNEFYPSLAKICPWPKDENWPASLSDKCLDYIDTLPRCKANIVHPFSLQDNNCIQAINSTLNYDKCVELHKNDKDFYQKEWRIYLNRSSELWKASRETIVLRDKSGNAISRISY